MTPGEVREEHRKRLGISKNQLAKRTGITRETISRHVNDGQVP
ncbi:MAG TPA: helix-turn-helix domain-containing protein [Candidatus Krumholzibacteria bacterium]